MTRLEALVTGGMWVLTNALVVLVAFAPLPGSGTAAAEPAIHAVVRL